MCHRTEPVSTPTEEPTVLRALAADSAALGRSQLLERAPAAVAVLDPPAASAHPPWWRPGRPVLAAVLLAAVLQLVWACFLATNGGDMAAQYAWAQFAAAHPGSAYDLAWYGGMHPVSYSVLTPYLMAFLGVRTSAVLAGTVAAALLARLLTRSGIDRPLLPALCGAAGLACDTASGRVTFGVGACFALGAVLAVQERRDRRAPWIVAAGLLGVLATLASPVDGLFLLVAAPALALTGRRAEAVALAVGPPLVVGTTTLLFPFYGVQPNSSLDLVLVLVTALAVALFSPRSWRSVRFGAWIYVLGNLLALAIPSPVGSNVERLALLFAATVLLAAARASGGRRARVLWLAFAVAFCWQTVQPVFDLADTVPAAGWTRYAQPLGAELERLGADRARVEVVGAASHVEASSLTPFVELARGWNRQVDIARNPLFYDGALTAAGYRAWLATWAVGYVVLPDAVPDYGSAAESRIVAAGPSWLHPVWRDPHWTVYRVADAAPLASAPARVLHAGAAELTLRLSGAGSTVLRIAWSPWLDLLGGAGGGCLTQDGHWTRLTAVAAGTYTVGARYTLPRGTPCR
ncbi:MFS transporter [Streptacidiphilus cavernicola]|uniref:MFS transporter n=1 Tax=Streptacidiphilus cavernicola TaxID=3342716 RepID=A0ABV6W4K3_9ACTN